MGQLKETLFCVDYLELKKITERDLVMLHAKYHVLESVRWQILGPIESLNHPKDSNVVFFIDILKFVVQLPL